MHSIYHDYGLCTQFLDSYPLTNGQIYSTPEQLAWFNLFLPGGDDHDRAHVLDGDLPKREWFAAERSPRHSAADGEIHTVVPGGPIGLHPPLVAQLAEQGIHLHFYGDFHRGQWPTWVNEVRRVAPGRFHLHPQVDQERWVAEFSQYDAGWLHLLKSDNRGDLRQASWGDLNYPARIPTLLSAGVPLIQYDNAAAVVATQ